MYFGNVFADSKHQALGAFISANTVLAYGVLPDLLPTPLHSVIRLKFTKKIEEFSALFQSVDREGPVGIIFHVDKLPEIEL